MRGSPERRNNGWWISPAIPMIANAVLALLWGFSAFGGWGRTAFCDNDSGSLGAGCSGSFDTAAMVSAVPAFMALILSTGSWALPAVRRDPHLLDALLTIAALTWLLAEGVLFVGGWLAQH